MSQPPYPPPQASGAPGSGPGGERDATRPSPAVAWADQPPYGQPPYGQAQYGRPTYPPQSGYPPQAGYGQPPPYAPGPPPWIGAGAPGPPPATKSSTPMIMLIVAGVLVLAGIGAALWFGLRGDDAAGIPPATQEPAGLGSDPVMDGYAQDCYDGDMGACDELFLRSPVDSAYESYGGTCAGRQPEAVSAQIYCVDAFSG